MYVALTGDLIDSNRLNNVNRAHLFSILQHDLEHISKEYDLHFPFEFIRGDGFQCLFTDIEMALNIALQLKTIFKKITFPDQDKDEQYNHMDARISIGIGSIDFLHSTLALSDGQALQLSGRNLERMKQLDQKLIIHTADQEINRELKVELKLLEAIIDRWSKNAAETAYFLLQGLTEAKTAEKLMVSQSAVNQRKKAANWDATQMMLNNFKHLANKLKTE
ncbi:SatD family protein [Halosquirtibacter xylanolyticus]|uniref:SatD family protein n=1 Tax=Halosquirtibacter xylanolyticus TaxID=3374599 RepID=UPI00374A8459|nr:SatD family protein [Prolixibacteraceae bacterium]